MKLGFLGTGAITSAIVTGLNSIEKADHLIALSPRNREVAAGLARQFAKVSVAASNQKVLDACDIVVIAVRPQIASEVLAELRFRAGQNVISLVAGLPVARLAEMVSPASRISRAVPLPSVARRRCPTAIYPHDAESEKIFSALGTAFAVDTEREFDLLCSATSTMAAYFAFADGIKAWLTRHGVGAAEARGYMGQILAGLAATAMENPDLGFPELAVDHATRGGTNEQFLAYLRAHGVFESMSEGLDAILQRVTAASK